MGLSDLRGSRGTCAPGPFPKHSQGPKRFWGPNGKVTMSDFTDCRCGNPILVAERLCRECKVLEAVIDNPKRRKHIHLKAVYLAAEGRRAQHDEMAAFLKAKPSKPSPPTVVEGSDLPTAILMAMNVQQVRAGRRAWKSRTLIDRLQD